MAEFKDFDWARAEYGDAYIQSIFNFCVERNFKSGLEVGFDSGSSALAFLRACPEARLLSIDIDLCGKGNATLRTSEVSDRFSFRAYDSRIDLPLMAEQYGKEPFDYVYIDGDHLYEAAKQDIENGWALLQPGGFMLVDDADPDHGHFGCGRAIYEHANKLGLQLTILAGNPNRAVYLQKPL